MQKLRSYRLPWRNFNCYYNMIQTVGLRFNIYVNLLVSRQQAKCALLYTVDYFSKDGVKISNALLAASSAHSQDLQDEITVIRLQKLIK